MSLLQLDDNEKARAALGRLAPWRCDDRDEWIKVGMALHSLGDDMADAWLDWSRRSEKFNENECRRQWRSFQRGRNGVGLGTLIDMAKKDSPGASSRTAAKPTPRIIERYVYHDADGNPQSAKVRLAPKEFRWQVPGRTRDWVSGCGSAAPTLYRLPDLLKASPESIIYIVEGEKDADRLAADGLFATTYPWGFKGGIDAVDDSVLDGHDVRVIPDHDAEGYKKARTIIDRLAGRTDVRVVRLPADRLGFDVSDYLATGRDIEDLWRLAEAAPEYDEKQLEWNEPDVERAATGNGLVCCGDIEDEVVEWLWDGHLPFGKLALLSARPKIGKGKLTCDLAARITTGAAMPDRSPMGGERGSVLYLGHEDQPNTVRTRVRQQSGDPDRVHCLHPEEAFDLRDGLPKLDAWIRYVPDVRLVVIDPLSDFLPDGVDMNSERQVREVLHPLRAFVEARPFALLLIAHNRKAKGDSAQEAVMGATAFVGVARMVWALGKDKDDPDRRFLTCAGTNLAREFQSRAFTLNESGLRWGGVVNESADELLGEGGPTKRGTAKRFLLDELGDGQSRPASEIIEKAKVEGIAESTLQRAKRDLGVTSGPDGFQGPFVWQLDRSRIGGGP